MIQIIPSEPRLNSILNYGATWHAVKFFLDNSNKCAFLASSLQQVEPDSYGIIDGAAGLYDQEFSRK